MSRFPVPSRSRVWPRAAVIALAGTVGISVAGCSDSARFDSNPYASNRAQPSPEVTGSIAQRPMQPRTVTAQPLPAPSRPATVAARGGYSSGYSGGAQGLGAYRPSVPARNNDVTGTVPEHRVPQRVAAAPPRGGSEVHVVKPGETLIGIARRHGMSLSALARFNHMDTFKKLSVGDRVMVPSGHPGAVAAERRAPAPRLAKPRSMPVQPETVASVPTQKARVARAEAPVEAAPQVHESAVKKAEPAGGIPSFRWPVRGRIIAGFGPRPNGSQNDGINLAVPEGTPIKAADDGVVAYAGNELKGYGNLVLIRHANGYVSAYANASKLLVKRGDEVRRGQVIANAGQTGNVTSPQLHFEIRKGSTPVDPTKYLGGA
jgi:murein DD-endopeptidase MepM/ murein hydrolase activator NlpD